MKVYLTEETFKKVVVPYVLRVALNDLLSEEPKVLEELFGKELKWVKVANTHLGKALRSIDADDFEKVMKFVERHHFDVKLKFSNKLDPEIVEVKKDALYNLAELAIGKNCTECNRKDYRNCKLFQVLRECNIPAAQNVKGECPYKIS